MDIRKTIHLPEGKYVAAISGGVDSMVLLDMLRQLPHVKLTVAHFDHGIRTDSHLDRQLVGRKARKYGLPFVYSNGELGEGTSEEKARNARYDFLRKVQKQAGADGIITAHHMNDVLETATHNLLRGTGRKGMASLKSVDGIIRPLLHLPKSKLLEYADANSLEWREDSTNTDMRYRRNYIRHKLLPALQEKTPQKYEQFKRIIKRQADLNRAIDNSLHTFLHVQPSTTTLRRHDVIILPHNVALELVGEWLRKNGLREFSRPHLERATIAIKTAHPKTTLMLGKDHHIEFDKKHARFKKIIV